MLHYESTYTYLHQAALFGTLTLPYSPRNNELFSHLLHFMNIKILCTLHIYICIHMYMRMFILYLTYLIDISGYNLFSNLLFYEDKTTMVLSFVRLRRDVEELIPWHRISSVIIIIPFWISFKSVSSDSHWRPWTLQWTWSSDSDSSHFTTDVIFI